MDQGYDQRSHTIELLIRVPQGLVVSPVTREMRMTMVSTSGASYKDQTVAGDKDSHLGWAIACRGSGVDLVPLRFCIS